MGNEKEKVGEKGIKGKGFKKAGRNGKLKRGKLIVS